MSTTVQQPADTAAVPTLAQLASTAQTPLERKRLLAAAMVEKRSRLLQADGTRLAGNFSAFCKAAWKQLEPGRPLEWSEHYDLISEYLTLVAEGRFRQVFPKAQGIIINVPPRTAKSSQVTVFFPAFVWANKPDRRFMCASYSAGLAVEHSVKRRDLILSKWYQERWGTRFVLKGDVNQKVQFDNDRTGQMIATSVGGTATGKGGDIMIIDDPVNPEQALSDVERKTANDWIDNTLRSRRNDPANDVIIMVMQRLHELDCTGYLLNQEPDAWVHLNLPLVAEDDAQQGASARSYTFPISGKVFTRPVGSVLLPKRFPPTVVEALQRLRLVYAGQYQQRPAPLEGNLIKRSDVRYYNGVDPDTAVRDRLRPGQFDLVVTSADCTFKELETSDFVAVMTTGVKGPDRFVLELTLNHLDLPGTEEEILRQRKAHGSQVVLVEDKANGPAVIKRLKLKISGVLAVNPEGGKMSRMYAASGEWQSGNWWLPRTAAWTGPFIESITKFPGNRYDDDADAMSQTAIYLQKHGQGLFALWQGQHAALQQAAGSQAPHGVDEQKRDFVEKMQQAKGLGKIAVSAKTERCNRCGNAFLQRFHEGVWRCNNCGNHGQDTEQTAPEASGR